jgi:excisionase family DNA binding protein
MEIITTLRREDLEKMITDSVTKGLNEFLKPPQTESDRCQLKDACEITGLGKPAIYKLTSEKKIPYMKFGSRLVFSRQKLAAWVEEHTLPSSSPADELNDNLVKSAEKQLRHAK